MRKISKLFSRTNFYNQDNVIRKILIKLFYVQKFQIFSIFYKKYKKLHQKSKFRKINFTTKI